MPLAGPSRVVSPVWGQKGHRAGGLELQRMQPRTALKHGCGCCGPVRLLRHALT